jgi:hypothetical protein
MAVDPENPLVPRRVLRGNRAGHLQREVKAICAESEARMAGVSEEMSSIETEPQEFGVLEEGMMSVKSEDSPLLALLIAASSGVLHLVRQDETPNPQEQFDQGQDNDEEMVDAPRH